MTLSGAGSINKSPLFFGGIIGSRSGYNRYVNDKYQYTSDELTGAKAQLGL